MSKAKKQVFSKVKAVKATLSDVVPLNATKPAND